MDSLRNGLVTGVGSGLSERQAIPGPSDLASVRLGTEWLWRETARGTKHD